MNVDRKKYGNWLKIEEHDILFGNKLVIKS